MRAHYLDYPRAADADRLPDGDPIGYHEMRDLTGRSTQAVWKWHEKGALPLADGPIVHGRVTWRRRTFLAWAALHDFHRDRDGEPLRIFDEAQSWAKTVPHEKLIDLRDLEPQPPWPTTAP